jgi:hypothetical protein
MNIITRVSKKSDRVTDGRRSHIGFGQSKRNKCLSNLMKSKIFREVASGRKDRMVKVVK